LRLRTPLLAFLLALLLAPAGAFAYTTGIGDEQPQMFSSPYFTVLHTKIARYIVAYDVVRSKADLAVATEWIQNAESQGIQPLIAFYHSRKTATKMPSVHAYEHYVGAFLKLFPEIKNYQPWNEANRGNVREPGGGSFSSPSPKQSAQYYTALRHMCRSCTVVGLDVLDQNSVSSTIRYINAFKHDLGSRHVPRLWGLHNYSDTNRFRDSGTTKVLNDVPGQVWLTETGGVVKFGGAFPNSQTRAAKALVYMFRLADRHRSRITRLYIFQWTGGNVSRERFDAGLMNGDGTPRCGYYVVANKLTHQVGVPSKCLSHSHVRHR
jgi:hypothetical protein